MKTLVSVQYLRAIAAIAVVIFHSNNGFLVGQVGVDIFFVISGFVMWSVTNKPTMPTTFFRQRLFRIVPMYWIATLLGVFLVKHQAPNLFATMQSMLFIPYKDTGGHTWPIIIQGWTLNIEMFFYVVFALALCLPRRIQLITLTSLLGFSGIIGIAWPSTNALAYTYSNPLLLEFVAGMWLAKWYQMGWAEKGHPTTMIVVGLVGITFAGAAWTSIYRPLLWGIPSALIVAGMIGCEVRYGMHEYKPFKLLGDASYSIYLFHPFAIEFVGRVFKINYAILLPMQVLCACLAGIAIYYMLEQPIIKLLKSKSNRLTQVQIA
jgi:exopolysaccharide production protein ExoZ